MKTLPDDVREALEEAGQLAERIYPPLLDRGGLAVALRSAAVGAGVRVSLDVPAGASYPPEVAATVYRCCSEAFTRAGPGAQAAVTVRNGAGAVAFDVVANLSELGLDGLRDRVEALGGRLTFGAEPDGGSRLSGSLPLSG